jgi:hypothetical protein
MQYVFDIITISFGISNLSGMLSENLMMVIHFSCFLFYVLCLSFIELFTFKISNLSD